MKRTLIATLMITVATGGIAFAQTTPAPATTDTPAATQAAPDAAPAPGMGASPGSGTMQSQGGFYTYQEGDQMLGSGLMGARVMGAGDENIGQVKDLLLDRDGQVMAVVVGVGGFLGIGEKDVAIANDQLDFVLSQDAGAETGAASTGTATAPGAATTAPATAPGMATTPGGAATGTTTATGTGTATTGAMAPGNGTATGMMGNGWGWSGAGIDHIQVNFTREQLEGAPAFETAE